MMKEEIRILKEIVDNNDLDNYTIDDDECYLNGYARKCLKKVLEEIERLNKKIEQYENPEDMTLMFMWCDEKAKDEIKRLNNIINEFNEFIEEVYNHINLGDESDEFMLVFDKWQELKGVDKE